MSSICCSVKVSGSFFIPFIAVLASAFCTTLPVMFLGRGIVYFYITQEICHCLIWDTLIIIDICLEWCWYFSILHTRACPSPIYYSDTDCVCLLWASMKADWIALCPYKADPDTQLALPPTLPCWSILGAFIFIGDCCYWWPDVRPYKII